MRVLARPNIGLPTLATGRGAAAAAANLGRLGGQESFKFPDHWNQADVRGALYAMHGRACAYCQCNLPHGDRGDVEHFRPKDSYWWLAYDFDNYFLSCRACNSHRKKARFPLSPGALPCRYEDRAGLDREDALLLDPARDPVEQWTRFQIEDPDFLFPVVPADGLSTQDQARVEATLEFFDWNGDALLVRERKAILETALRTLSRARNGDADSRLDIQRMASRHRPFGIAVRQLVAASAPALLPAAEDELLFFLHDFLEGLLETLHQILARYPRSTAAQRQRDEVCYALALVWKHPPAASAAFVEQVLVHKGCRETVAPYHRKLGA